ncbi:hypothetical protein ACLESO_24075 [Pyxidicoccus sp. 3LG]
MASVYDLILRRLVQGHPEQLLLLLFGPDAPTLVRAADTSLPQSERRADALLIVEAHGERFAVEVEVQAQPEAGFSRRLLDYAVRAHLREGLPVLPVALYLLPEAEGAPPPYTFACAGRRVLSFDFRPPSRRPPSSPSPSWSGRQDPSERPGPRPACAGTRA